MNLAPLAGGVVAIDPTGRHLFLYNEAAAFVLTAWQAGHAVDTIVSELSAITGLPSDTAAASVGELIAGWTMRSVAAGSASTTGPASVVTDEPQRPATPPSPQHYIIAGRSFAVTIAEGRVRSHVEATLAPFLATAAAPAAPTVIDLALCNRAEPYVLRIDGTERLRVGTAPDATGAVFQHLLQAIRPGVSWLALIHGAAVSTPDGRAIVFAGAGGSGKSTLAAHLSRTGHGFLTDDMVALRALDGAVVPWPLPHSLKRGSWSALATLYPELADAQVSRVHDRDVRFVAAADEDWHRAPAPVAAIVFPRFVPDEEDAIETVTSFDALRRLIEDRLWLGETLTVDAVEAFVAWLEQVPAYAIRYGSSAGAERLIRSALG